MHTSGRYREESQAKGSTTEVRDRPIGIRFLGGCSCSSISSGCSVGFQPNRRALSIQKASCPTIRCASLHGGYIGSLSYRLKESVVQRSPGMGWRASHPTAGRALHRYAHGGFIKASPPDRAREREARKSSIQQEVLPTVKTPYRRFSLPNN